MLHSIDFPTFKRFAFPFHLGIIMPLIMNCIQGQLRFPQFFIQLLVILPVSIVLGALILDIPKLSKQVTDFIGIKQPEWLVFFIGQFPPAIIFSCVMGLIAVIMQGELNPLSLIGVIKGLPLAVLVSVPVQILVTLLIDKGYKKWFFSRNFN